MKLCVSQLAHNDVDVLLNFISSIEIRNIEIVYSKINSWNELNFFSLEQFKSKLQTKNINCPSTQSLFYGLSLSLANTQECIQHMDRLIRYSKLMGVKLLVFGSPNLRKKFDNYEIYVKNFFKNVDDLLEGTDIRLAIEPNCRVYGGEYFTTIPEIVQFLEENQLKNIVTMVDFHNVKGENMNPCEMLERYINKIGHIHVSEPGLKSIVDAGEHREFSSTIYSMNYKDVVTYEILYHEQILNDILSFKELYWRKDA